MSLAVVQLQLLRIYIYIYIYIYISVVAEASPSILERCSSARFPSQRRGKGMQRMLRMMVAVASRLESRWLSLHMTARQSWFL